MKYLLIILAFIACSEPFEVDSPEMAGSEQEIEEPACLYIAEQMPEFPGGTSCLYDFIRNNIRYPNSSFSLEGRVFIQFTIERDGSISEPTVVKGFDEAFNEDAIRVVKMMPKWKPGKQRGQPVRMRMILPITFHL